MIEVEVHQRLRAFLKEQGEPYWPHHLTMARLVARALRMNRSALIQAGTPSGYFGRYRLSYLMPALMWPKPVVLVVPDSLRQRLLMVEIPRLQQWISTPKSIQMGDRWPGDHYQGIWLTSPQNWLAHRLRDDGSIPNDVLTVIDGADDLEAYAREQLTVAFRPIDWEHLMLACPNHREAIRDVRIRLTRSVFQHPVNPYECHLIEQPEQDVLIQLDQHLSEVEPQHQGLDRDLAAQPGSNDLGEITGRPCLTEAWNQFLAQMQRSHQLIWTTVNRQQGQFSLHCSPIDVAPVLQPIWDNQPIVLIGGLLDLETEATTFRQRLGLQDLTCLKFSPDRQNELIQLYLPERMPMPNTPQFQRALMNELRVLLGASATVQGLTVVLVGDTPLKRQTAAQLAAEFGSRVQVEKTCLDENAILVTGWEFWQQHQAVLPAPRLLAIATLPIPSLEHPLVAGRVAYYKRLRQNWFQLYLLPATLNELHRAIAPIRESKGVVALLDNRVNHRSYGQQILSALSPHARINYVDAELFA
ncbi:MAG: helicase C-terminal domain-containing protein [Elainellaceae cyanobacterium]